jgi:tRNA(fMet)-specific endonuclease VapC
MNGYPNGYLLDTDTCVSRLRRKFAIDRRIDHVGKQSCFLSEITIAELRFGAERGNQREEQMFLIDSMYDEFTVLPITPAIRHYASEKVRLWSTGQKIEDLDLLIGATALRHGLILVTNNTKHFERMQSLQLDNWMRE